MKQKLLLILLTFFLIKIQAQVEPRYESYNVGQAFTTITVDGFKRKVWAGTNQSGVFSIDTVGVNNGTDFIIFNESSPEGPPLDNIKIKSMAADKLGNIWIGHQGIDYVGIQGGMERINTALNVKHYASDRNFIGIGFHGRDGLGTRRLTSVAVDKNNKVWVAQKYDDLTVTGSGGGYYVTPGALSFKEPYVLSFETKGGWFPGYLENQPAELPYPAWTKNPPYARNAQSRTMDALSVDKYFAWVSVRGYFIRDADDTDRSNDTNYENNAYVEPRILVYRLRGSFTEWGSVGTYKGFSFSDMNIPTGGIINGICANDRKGTWVTTSFTGKGFSVYKRDRTWQYIHRDFIDENGRPFTQLIPEGTRFNDNAMWKDEIGRVFMGTNKGLIVYNGHGNPSLATSYKIYTNYDYGASTGNTLNVYDSNMLSSNINGGCSDPKNRSRSWVVTDTGIMKLFLPPEGMAIYNIRDHSTYETDTSDNDDNIRIITRLKDVEQGVEVLDEEIPLISADGSSSTIFRFKTNDVHGYYDADPAFRLMVGPGPLEEIDTDNYIKKYGKFTKKELSSYPGSPAVVDDLPYVEFIYTHPKFIEEYSNNENYAIYDYKIMNVTDVANPTEEFKHPIKIAVPPVLILHGVWSNTYSVDPIRAYLQTEKNFKDYTLSVQWRTIKDPDNFKPENSFSQDADIIPNHIKILKNSAADNMYSVGKVNVVAHSRGGLYTRGYIEELSPGSRSNYKDDVNSLITLDTPHWGAQGANLVLDKRPIVSVKLFNNVSYVYDLLATGSFPDDIDDYIDTYATTTTLGDMNSAISVPKKDRTINGGQDWGAKNLVVENDHVSGLNASDNISFIPTLNSQANLAKLDGVPIHTISATVKPCGAHLLLCNQQFDEDFTFDKVDKLVMGRLGIMAVIATYGGIAGGAVGGVAINEGLTWFTGQLYGEPSDFVVPVSSQQGGLGGTDFNTHYPNDNDVTIEGIIDHSGAVGLSVAKHPTIHAKIYELLRSNVYEEENGLFSQHGLGNYTPLTYNLLEGTLGSYQARDVSFVSKILINRDPVIFDNRLEGDILNFNIYQEDIDRIMVTYENVNDSKNMGIEMRSQNLAFQNAFTYTIPSGYSGKLKITSYGFKNGVLGIATNVVTLDIGVPSDITLQGIYFSVEEPVILNQENYTYGVIGTYSDGIDRILNNADITFSIEDTDITSQVDNSTIKGEQEGSTLLTAAINGFEDTILVRVVENLSLNQTILTGFYGIPNTDNSAIDVNWETLREYESATFVLETSYNTPDSFTEINQQAGNGTIQTPAQFNFADTLFGANTLIYYRIKMIDTQGNITYSSTIEINLSTAEVGENNLKNLVLEIYPNPVKTDEVTLKLNSKLVDANAKIELYSLQGKRLSLQTLKVLEGANSFKLKIGQGLTSGIYFVKVSTKGYVKTIKLIVEK